MDSSLQFLNDLARIKQRDWEAAAAQQRPAMSVAQLSRWARRRPLFGRRPADRLRRPEPSGVQLPRLTNLRISNKTALTGRDMA